MLKSFPFKIFTSDFTPGPDSLDIVNTLILANLGQTLEMIFDKSLLQLGCTF